MPLDPSIILSAQNYSDLYAKDQAQAAAQQAAQSQQQLAKYSVLEAKQDWDDQQNMRTAFRQANGDPTQILAIAAQLGVSPKTLTAFQAQQLGVRQHLADLDKTQTDTGKTKLDMLNEKNERLYNTIAPLLSVTDPNQFAAKLPGTIQSAVSAGVINDDQAKAASQMTPQALQDFANTLLNTKAHSEAVKAQTDIQNANSKTSLAQTAADKQANESAGQIADAVLKQRTDAAAQLTGAYNTGGPLAYKEALSKLDPTVAGYFSAPEQVAGAPTMNAARKLIGQGGMTAEQLATQQHNDDSLAQQVKYQQNETAIGLARLNNERQNTAIAAQREAREQQQAGFINKPGEVSDTAKAIVNGSLDPQTSRAMLRKNPGLINQVMQVDPNFDEAGIENRYFTLRQFTNTSVNSAGGQLLAANTLVSHAALFRQAVQAMNNGSFVPGNDLYNRFTSAFGSPDPNNVKLIGTFLAGEAGKLAQGGSPHEAEMKTIMDALNNANSTKQLNSATDQLINLGVGRLKSLKDRADGARISNVVKVVGSDTAEALQGVGIDPQTLKAVATGATGSASQGFIPKGSITASGPGGNKIFSTDRGTTWWDAKTRKAVQ